MSVNRNRGNLGKILFVLGIVVEVLDTLLLKNNVAAVVGGAIIVAGAVLVYVSYRPTFATTFP